MGCYRCANCGQEAVHDGPLPGLYPFCSPRCKWVDLGEWLHEQYAIDRDATPDELTDTQRPGPLSPPADR
jgi:endogenous inhibitor of DNA gyrase (YacG/DUF329 family)